jgi:hypothetical protein
MKISQLPPEIKEKAIAYRESAVRDFGGKESDNLIVAFHWCKTSEGSDFWNEWHHKDFEPITHQLQQLSTQYPNDLEFGAQVRKLISEL